MNRPETVKIDGIEYVVEIANSPEQHEADGRANVAKHMRDNGHACQFYLRRPNGRRLFFAIQTTQGTFSPVTSLKGF